jgi:hypothetical protein
MASDLRGKGGTSSRFTVQRLNQLQRDDFLGQA